MWVLRHDCRARLLMTRSTRSFFCCGSSVQKRSVHILKGYVTRWNNVCSLGSNLWQLQAF